MATSSMAANTTNVLSSQNSTDSSFLLTRLLTSLSNAIKDMAQEQQRSVQNLQELQDLEASRVVLNFNYFVSPYAGVCMIMAILLNRTVVFASSRSSNNRRRKTPSTAAKFALRSIAIFFLLRMLGEVVLQFTLYSPGLRGFLINANKMISTTPLTKLRVDALLWRIFITLCASQFLETFLSIASGQLPSNDTGLTLFEQSLAFQESQFLKNPPIQLLVILLFSLTNQLIIQVLGLTNLKKYQLIPSTIMGVLFLSYFVFNIYTGDLINFPWIVVISVTPQLAVLSITSFCMSIYGLAVWINGSSEELTYTPMMKNLRDSLNVQLNDDFNSVLMRFGLIIFTAVDNEDYVNEYSSLVASTRTYLEKDNDDIDGTGYLLSGYFNKVENNREIMKKLTVTKATSSDVTVINSWLILKKFSNLWKLVRAFSKLAVKKLPFLKSKKPPKKITIPTNLSGLFLSTSKFPLQSNTPFTVVEENVFTDDSEDFQYESESDLDPLEFDSDAEELEQSEYIPTLSSLRELQNPNKRPFETPLLQQPPPPPTHKEKPLNELFQSKDLIQLINPTSIDDVSLLNSLRTHLSQDQRITRSKYAEINQDDLLREVILKNRNLATNTHTHDHDHIEDSNIDETGVDEFEETPCVVCQTNQRSIILWPCKCFALCESCRVNLGVRGFRICVCCRGNVEGFSKVFIP